VVRFTVETADAYLIDYEFSGDGSSIQLAFPNVSNDIRQFQYDGGETNGSTAGVTLVENQFAEGKILLNVSSNKTQIRNQLGTVETTNMSAGGIDSSSAIDTIELQAFGVSPSGDWTVDVYTIP